MANYVYVNPATIPTPEEFDLGDYRITKVLAPPPSWTRETWNRGYYEEPWLEMYRRRTPYNEDEIVALIHEYITLTEKLARRDDEEHRARFPPPGGHVINEELCRKHGANQTVISLMKQLPYTTSWDGVHWDTWSCAIDYSEDSAIEERTECPSCPVDEEASEYLNVEPHVLCLTNGDRDSLKIFLDTEENTIHVTSIQHWPRIPPTSGYQVPPEFDGTAHYRAFVPKHAPSWLRNRILQLKTLDLIPGSGDDAKETLFSSRMYAWVWLKIKDALIGTYGWPDNFDEERWNLEKEQLWNDSMEQDRAIGSPHLHFIRTRV